MATISRAATAKRELTRRMGFSWASLRRSGRAGVLAGEPEQVGDLLVDTFRRSGVARADRDGRACLEVVAEHGLRHSVERLHGRADLLEDLHAVPAFLDHALKSAHLPFHAP